MSTNSAYNGPLITEGDHNVPTSKLYQASMIKLAHEGALKTAQDMNIRRNREIVAAEIDAAVLRAIAQHTKDGETTLNIRAGFISYTYCIVGNNNPPITVGLQNSGPLCTNGAEIAFHAASITGGNEFRVKSVIVLNRVGKAFIEIYVPY